MSGAPPRSRSGQPHTLVVAAEALVRKYPNALVCALSESGLITEMPEGFKLENQQLVVGRSLLDFVLAEDRARVIQAWQKVLREGVATVRSRLAENPSIWVETQLIDLRAAHGMLIAFILPPGTIEPLAGDEEEEGQIAAGEVSLPQEAVNPRYCWLHEDEGANVIDCDESYTRMFGYSPEEVIGQGVVAHIHPDDQGRAAEAWLQMLSTNRDQYYRCRRRHKDGHWMWVDSTIRNYLNDPTRGYVLVELLDVSSEMRVQEALAEREELLSRLTETMPVGLLQLDSARQVVYHNRYLLEVLGVELPKRAKATVDRLLATLTESSRREFDVELERILADGRDRDLEVDVELGEQGWRRVLFALRALRREGEQVAGVIMCALDVTERARARLELERRATQDSLTLCLNRQEMLERIGRELESGQPTGVIYVDLDAFKPVNDRYGHAAGDELLQLVGERLRAATRKGDDVGRLGGDEFIVLLRRIRSPESAMRSARRIARAVAGRYHTSFGTVPIRASVGVACLIDGRAQVGARRVERLTAEDLINLADEAMYESKGRAEGVPVLAEPVCATRRRAQAARPVRETPRRRGEARR